MASPAIISALQAAVQAAPIAVRLTQYTSIFRQIIASSENLTDLSENLNAYTRTILEETLDFGQLLSLATALNDAYRSMFRNMPFRPGFKPEVRQKLSSLLRSKFAVADRDLVSRDNHTNSPLLRLPPELRNHIYAYAFDHAIAVYKYRQRNRQLFLQMKHNSAGLLLSCRQLNSEAQPYVGTHQYLKVYGKPRFLSHRLLSKPGRPDLIKEIVVRTPPSSTQEELDHTRQIAESWPALRRLEVLGGFGHVNLERIQERFEQLNIFPVGRDLTVFVGDRDSGQGHDILSPRARIAELKATIQEMMQLTSSSTTQ